MKKPLRLGNSENESCAVGRLLGLGNFVYRLGHRGSFNAHLDSRGKTIWPCSFDFVEAI